MRKTRFILVTVVVLLSLVLVSAALADSRSGDSSNPGEPPGQATPPVDTQTDSQSEDTGNPDGSSGQENPPIEEQPNPQSGYGPESLSGSLVTFDPSVGGDDYYHPGLNQTFCFKAETYTDDWEWVETLWQRFPDDWSINDVYVEGTPTCDGGSFGTFGWGLVGGSLNEIRIDHYRTQAPTDHCTAYYCIETLTGSGVPDEALESWYWLGDEFGVDPNSVCSSDDYTPDGEIACEEAVEPPAAIPSFLQGDFEIKASSTAPLTSVAVDPTSGYIYAQQDRGIGFFQYDPIADSWTSLADAPLDSGNNGGAAYLGGKIYTTYTQRFDLGIYNITADSWSTISSNVPETGVIATDGQYLYLVEGSTFKKYDPVSTIWTDLASPPFGFEPWGGLSYWEDTLYGHQGNGLTGFAKYDIASDTWTPLDAVPDGPVLGSTIDPVRGYYYTYGTYLGDPKWFVFDLVSENWSVETIPFFYSFDGGMAYVDTPGFTGVYFVEGELGTGFARYGPPLLLQPESIEVWLPAGTAAYTYPTSLEVTNNTAMDLGFRILELTDSPVVTLNATLSSPTTSGASSDDVDLFPVIQTAPTDLAGTGVLLVQDDAPWGTTSNEDILTANSVPYDTINSSQIATTDLSPYRMVIIPADQNSSYNANYNDNLAKFEAFINAGGIMLFNYCEQSFFTPYRLPPFGSTNNFTFEDFNFIVEPGHPIMAGVSSPYSGDAASHSYLTDLFPGDRVLATGGNVPGGNAIMIERPHGEGLLVAGGQTFEYGVLNNQGAGDILINMIPYYYFTWPDEIPWISEDPITGTAPANGMTSSSISFTTLVPDPLPIGTYTARLEVSNDVGGSFHSIPVTMHIGELPSPSFDYTTPANAGEPVTFTNTTTPGIPPETDYLWSFGDGETSTDENPSHTYIVGGTYPVSLQACNLAGCNTYNEDVLVISFLYLPLVFK